MLKLELIQSLNNEQELEREIIIMRDDLATTNEYRDKFKASSARLDELLKSQRDDNDRRGLGYEVGQSFGTTQQDESSGQKQNHANNRNQKLLVRQPNAHKFNGTCFLCNKYGHIESQCTNRNNQNNASSTGLGNFRCHACSRFGHMANQCRSNGNQGNQGDGECLRKELLL